MNKIRILSNVKLTNRLPEKVNNIDYFQIDKSSMIKHLKIMFRLLLRIRKYDVFLVFNADADAMLIAFLNRFLWLHKTMVIFYDLNLHLPDNFKARISCMIKKVLLTGVDRFFCMHKDMRSYQRYYNVTENKCYYIPFKANNYNVLSKYFPKDGDYVLSCGASYRDFKTLIKAITELNYPTKIVLPAKDAAKIHNTYLDERDLPKNIETIRHNYDFNSWNQYIADARLVVIPIQKKALQPAGISVYLEAMALGKPVIISEGTSTRGILTKNEAEIVPSEDPDSLALAIKKLWEDKDYRESLAKHGKKYALSLGEEERLVKDILKGICFFLENKGNQDAKST
jgi:glycosyltransferase involved in cell wall biosynthesis